MASDLLQTLSWLASQQFFLLSTVKQILQVQQMPPEHLRVFSTILNDGNTHQF